MSSASEENGTTLGHCLCNAISLAIPLTVEPSLSFICHCRDCQRNASGPYQVVVIFPSSSVRINGLDKILKEHTIPGSATLSGSDKVKAFCSLCGCTLFTVPVKWSGEKTVVRIALFDEGLGKWPPTQEWFVKSRPLWIRAAEGTKESNMAGGVGI
ncbi:hypothetical protein AOQ84DRAFT_307407 [Glonium stellatum]|uniref:CENP-V/GFA domain-containing protein n=1 Tax=Glonium stellatum TaxID=574774 RepID=A0A8E2K058_9PEZI|nr:hypothetical protein AOQ84DRAFT_307407 [Glonium stellatum]